MTEVMIIALVGYAACYFLPQSRLLSLDQRVKSLALGRSRRGVPFFFRGIERKVSADSGRAKRGNNSSRYKASAQKIRLIIE